MMYVFKLRGIDIVASCISTLSYIVLHSPRTYSGNRDLADIVLTDLGVDRNEPLFNGPGYRPDNNQPQAQLKELIWRYERMISVQILSKEEMERINKLNHV